MQSEFLARSRRSTAKTLGADLGGLFRPTVTFQKWKLRTSLVYIFPPRSRWHQIVSGYDKEGGVLIIVSGYSFSITTVIGGCKWLWVNLVNLVYA